MDNISDFFRSIQARKDEEAFRRVHELARRIVQIVAIGETSFYAVAFEISVAIAKRIAVLEGSSDQGLDRFAGGVSGAFSMLCALYEDPTCRGVLEASAKEERIPEPWLSQIKAEGPSIVERNEDFKALFDHLMEVRARDQTNNILGKEF